MPQDIRAFRRGGRIAVGTANVPASPLTWSQAREVPDARRFPKAPRQHTSSLDTGRQGHDNSMGMVAD